MIFLVKLMREIIAKTYELIDVLEKSTLIEKLKSNKEKSLNNVRVRELVLLYRETVDYEKLLAIKKELYEISEYRNYMDSYNELSLIVLRINQKYKEYTNTREHDI